METPLRVLASVLLFATASILPQAVANCPSARVIEHRSVTLTTPPGSFPGPYGPYSVSPDLKGVFWSFGAAPGGGNPAGGLGNDSGSINQWCWIYSGAYGYPARLDGGHGCSHWNAPGVDGCVDGDGTNPDAADLAQCTVLLFSDDDDAGRGYFALASVGPNANQNYDVSTVTGGAGIMLAPVPKPNITGSVRNGPQSIDLILHVPSGSGPAAGYYLGCQQSALMAGLRYRVYKRVVPAFASAPGGPDSRDLASWTLMPATAAGVPVGSPSVLNVPCGGPSTDAQYLCSTLLVPAGNGSFYELANCSRNATRIECSPNLADPATPPRPRPDAERVPPPGRRR